MRFPHTRHVRHALFDVQLPDTTRASVFASYAISRRPLHSSLGRQHCESQRSRLRRPAAHAPGTPYALHMLLLGWHLIPPCAYTTKSRKYVWNYSFGPLPEPRKGYRYLSLSACTTHTAPFFLVQPCIVSSKRLSSACPTTTVGNWLSFPCIVLRSPSALQPAGKGKKARPWVPNKRTQCHLGKPSCSHATSTSPNCLHRTAAQPLLTTHYYGTLLHDPNSSTFNPLTVTGSTAPHWCQHPSCCRASGRPSLSATHFPTAAHCPISIPAAAEPVVLLSVPPAPVCHTLCPATTVPPVPLSHIAAKRRPPAHLPLHHPLRPPGRHTAPPQPHAACRRTCHARSRHPNILHPREHPTGSSRHPLHQHCCSQQRRRHSCSQRHSRQQPVTWTLCWPGHVGPGRGRQGSARGRAGCLRGLGFGAARERGGGSSSCSSRAGDGIGAMGGEPACRSASGQGGSTGNSSSSSTGKSAVPVPSGSH